MAPPLRPPSPAPMHDSHYHLASMVPGFPPQAFPTTISSLTSPQPMSPQSTAAHALGFFHNPKLQLPVTAPSRGPEFLPALCRARRGGKNTQKNYTKKKKNHDPDNHDGVITSLEPDILECKVKWVLGSITKNKASGDDRIPVELFQILKDDAVKVLHSLCQQIWKIQQ